MPAPRAIAPRAIALRAVGLHAIVATLSLVPGCADRPGSDVAVAGAGATWRWRAERMELSALSTPIRAAGDRPAQVDARLEFFDSDGDETKAIGKAAVVAMFDGNEVGRTAADLGDARVHARSWDSVTETYSVPILLSVVPPPGRTLVLQANFEGIDGARMTASREVRWPETAR